MVQSRAVFEEPQVIHFAKSVECKPRVMGDKSGRSKQGSGRVLNSMLRSFYLMLNMSLNMLDTKNLKKL